MPLPGGEGISWHAVCQGHTDGSGCAILGEFQWLVVEDQIKYMGIDMIG